jgi:hypothetical protein
MYENKQANKNTSDVSLQSVSEVKDRRNSSTA